MLRLVSICCVALLWNACGGSSSSNSSKEVRRENLLGAWKLDDSRNSGGGRKFPKTVQASDYQSSQSSLYLFVTTKRVNMMAGSGLSSTCELDRSWEVKKKEVTLSGTTGCAEQKVGVTKVTNAELELTFADSARSYNFFKVSQSELHRMINQFSLSGSGLPNALSHYLAAEWSDNARSEQSESAGYISLQQ